MKSRTQGSAIQNASEPCVTGAIDTQPTVRFDLGSDEDGKREDYIRLIYVFFFLDINRFYITIHIIYFKYKE